MKEVNVKLISMVLVLVSVSIFILFKTDKNALVVALNKKNNISVKIEELINQNVDKELIRNENFNDKFVYLEFQKDGMCSSHFVDAKTGEEKYFLDYIKEEKREHFQTKIKDLLYLKYPNFIADILSLEDSQKTYQILQNELYIFYDNSTISPKVNEKLYLRVDYQEIQDCLDFPVSLGESTSFQDGYAYDKNKKSIAFTFDDGPNGEKTNKIVNLLEQNKAHATFFMVGNKMEYGKETILNVLNKGNEIGSHSYNHKNMKRMKIEDIISDEEKTKETFYNITGRELIYTRPPYGNVNQKIKESLNTIFVNWNLDTEDWLHRDKNHIVNYVMDNVNDGDIILMHDLYDSTVEAVEELLPKLYAEGYQVMSISELAKIKGKSLDVHSVYRSIKAD